VFWLSLRVHDWRELPPGRHVTGIQEDFSRASFQSAEALIPAVAGDYSKTRAPILLPTHFGTSDTVKGSPMLGSGSKKKHSLLPKFGAFSRGMSMCRMLPGLLHSS